MARHKEKDDEAGGEGLGHLATRKRLWRDADGKVIQGRRPYQQDKLKERQCSSASETQSVSSSNKRRRTIEAAPPSPPHSVQSVSGRVPCEPRADKIFQDPFVLDRAIPGTSDNSDQFNFLNNADWGTNAFDPSFVNTDSASLPYDDIFKPDTAMSFNAPFTTMSYYSWLFENDGPSNPTQQNAVVSHERMPMICTESSFPGSPGHMSGSLSPTSQDPFLSQDNFDQDFPGTVARNENKPVSDRTEDIREQPFNEQMSNTQDEALRSPHESADFSLESTDFSLEFGSIGVPSMFSVPQLVKSYPGGSNVSTPPSQRSPSLGPSILPDAYTARFVAKLPIITNEARDGLMDIISKSRPQRPDGSEISSSDPLLSLLSLQHYADLFFTRFNSSYPLIHQATFRSSEVHPFLLMAILLLGATYSDKEAHLLAVCVHDIMRPLIHASQEFGTRPKLWMLQTILLVECFGKSRAGEKQHDMSHLYHGLLINLIRRSDCQSASIPPFDSTSQELEDYWNLAVEAEQKRRYDDLIPVL